MAIHRKWACPQNRLVRRKLVTLKGLGNTLALVDTSTPLFKREALKGPLSSETHCGYQSVSTGSAKLWQISELKKNSKS